MTAMLQLLLLEAAAAANDHTRMVQELYAGNDAVGAKNWIGQPPWRYWWRIPTDLLPHGLEVCGIFTAATEGVGTGASPAQPFCD